MKILAVLNLALLLAGCASSPPTRFYVLSALPQPAQALGYAAGQEIAVGVGPIELPDYLDRAQLVTRSGQNELNLAEFDRWGESLKDNATQVLAENLALLLPSKKIAIYPWKRSTTIQYQVAAKITRFDHTQGGETALDVRWSIAAADGAELFSRQSHYAEGLAGDDAAATIAAMNRVLAQFSREVANTLAELQQNRQ